MAMAAGTTVDGIAVGIAATIGAGVIGTGIIATGAGGETVSPNRGTGIARAVLVSFYEARL